VNTNDGVKWRRFIVPKKVEQINDHLHRRREGEADGGGRAPQLPAINFFLYQLTYQIRANDA